MVSRTCATLPLQATKSSLEGGCLLQWEWFALTGIKPLLSKATFNFIMALYPDSRCLRTFLQDVYNRFRPQTAKVTHYLTLLAGSIPRGSFFGIYYPYPDLNTFDEVGTPYHEGAIS